MTDLLNMLTEEIPHTTEELVDFLSQHLVWDEHDEVSLRLSKTEESVEESVAAKVEDVVLDEGTIVVTEVNVPWTAPTESRKRRREGASLSPKAKCKPRNERLRSTHSSKFKTVLDEVQQRLYNPPQNKVDLLVRTFHARFGDRWVEWDEVKKIGGEIGYSPTGNVFKDTWVLRCSRYGRNSETVKRSEPFGLNFPYWNVETRTVDGAQKTFIQLSPEFFVQSVASV